MLVVTGTLENERFIPDRPVSIPQKKKVTITIDDTVTEAEDVAKAMPKFTKAQIEEWSQAPELQALVGILKDTGLPPDITMKDIRQMR